VKPRFFDGDFVVKPCVGAGSMAAERYHASQHDQASAHVTSTCTPRVATSSIQPYVSSVDTFGERALVFIDGEYSHAITKGAMLNVTELDRSRLYRHENLSLAEGEQRRSTWRATCSR
jgi:hypothetical protein